MSSESFSTWPSRFCGGASESYSVSARAGSALSRARCKRIERQDHTLRPETTPTPVPLHILHHREGRNNLIPPPLSSETRVGHREYGAACNAHLKGLLLLGLELGDPGGELSINLGLGGSERGSGLGLSLGLGVGDGLLGISAGGADDGLGLGGNLSDLARVALHVGELAADHTVAVIEGLAHGGEPELVKEHHEEHELGRHDGGGEVEVENLASVSGGGHGHEHVGERDGSTVAGSGGDLHLAEIPSHGGETRQTCPTGALPAPRRQYYARFALHHTSEHHLLSAPRGPHNAPRPAALRPCGPNYPYSQHGALMPHLMAALAAATGPIVAEHAMASFTARVATGAAFRDLPWKAERVATVATGATALMEVVAAMVR
mmetsp:Transcript_47655/g.152721  ORF Transcript_47655/g.152721 Transcript_47655/m.152721 type:complete len:377 (+) Transcript_47655:144-1274(+)